MKPLIKSPHIKRFLKLAEGLDKLMAEVREYCPEASYYAADSYLHLMQGTTHSDGAEIRDLQENVAADYCLHSLDGGAW